MNTVTVAICTITPKITIRAIKSIIPYSKKDQIIVVVDGKRYVDNELEEFAKSNNVDLFINENNMGLSYSRNLAISNSINDFIIFFDDDTFQVHDTIQGYKNWFHKGYDLVGGPLMLPSKYPRLPKWIPSGLSSLFGIHTNQEKIWGGNFGFNVRKALENNILFQLDLGRKANQLQAGDDTTFIKSFTTIPSVKWKFVRDLGVEHYIDKRRYTFKYLSKRAYWQGRCEVRRNSIVQGITKEFKRAFIIDIDRYVILKFVAGLILYLSFLYGVFVEIINKIHIYMGVRKDSNVNG